VRTVLICHAEAPLHRDGIARWLASVSELAGILVIAEPPRTRWRRARRELRRSGIAGFLDVIAFRAYYRLAWARSDRAWSRRVLTDLRSQFLPVPPATPICITGSPNSAEAQQFVRAAEADVALALCKTILRPAVFETPRFGTFVLHPGICPEYRNAHGCFWALATRDLRRVGMTLLRVDRGIDTGPIFGQYGCSFDERRESHVVIQHRAVLENLTEIGSRLVEIVEGDAVPIDVGTRHSAVWGQPRLTAYLHWKAAARRAAHESTVAALS
jgi:hypothetical protein